MCSGSLKCGGKGTIEVWGFCGGNSGGSIGRKGATVEVLRIIWWGNGHAVEVCVCVGGAVDVWRVLWRVVGKVW